MSWFHYTTYYTCFPKWNKTSELCWVLRENMHLLLRGQIWSKKPVKSSFCSDGQKWPRLQLLYLGFHPGHYLQCPKIQSYSSSPLQNRIERNPSNWTMAQESQTSSHFHVKTIGATGPDTRVLFLGEGVEESGLQFPFIKVLSLSGSRKL